MNKFVDPIETFVDEQRAWWRQSSATQRICALIFYVGALAVICYLVPVVVNHFAR